MHATRCATAEQPHDIDLMRRLAPDDAAAIARRELLGAAWPIDEIGEVQGGQHPQLPECARCDQLARTKNRRVETVAVPDDQVDVRASGVVDH